jgi:hypothetical protein
MVSELKSLAGLWLSRARPPALGTLDFASPDELVPGLLRERAPTPAFGVGEPPCLAVMARRLAVGERGHEPEKGRPAAPHAPDLLEPDEEQEFGIALCRASGTGLR